MNFLYRTLEALAFAAVLIPFNGSAVEI